MDTQMWTVEGRLDPPALGRHTPWVPMTGFMVGRAQSQRGFATAAVRVFPTREGALLAAAQWAAEQGGPAQTRAAAWRRDPVTEPARVWSPGLALSPGFRQKLGLPSEPPAVLPPPRETWTQRVERAAQEEAKQVSTLTAEQIARAFHEAYERLAPDFGYRTREASAKPWEQVPGQNKDLMAAVVRSLIDAGVIYPADAP